MTNHPVQSIIRPRSHMLETRHLYVTKMELYGVILVALCAWTSSAIRYEATWASLDTRPRPKWFDGAKIGIMLHWGVYSVPSVADSSVQEEWFEYYVRTNTDKYIVNYVKNNFPPDHTYADFAKQFTAELYDPDHWADVIQASGAKYIALTAKHHEGYCLWPSKYAFNWNSKDVGSNRDLVGELATSLRNRTDVRFGVYHSLYEWFNPLYQQDKANKYKTQYFVEQKAMPALYELVNTYKPELIWSDGDWDANSTYWNSTHFLAWLYNDSPVKDTIVVNDRWGKDANCRHGDYWNCHDKYNPKHPLARKWEDVEDVDLTSFGFRRNMKYGDVRTMEGITTLIAQVVSCGGNLLLNVGPTKDGTIIPIFEERLRQMGQWLKVNAEGIYNTSMWKFQEDPVTKDAWYTSKEHNVYAIVLHWPKSGTLTLGAPITTSSTKVKLLGYNNQPFKWTATGAQGINITIPIIPAYEMPCEWAWVFRLQNLKNAF